MTASATVPDTLLAAEGEMKGAGEMVYGQGQISCQVAIANQWSAVDAAWVAGFASGASWGNPHADTFPGGDFWQSATYQECQHDTSRTLANAAATVFSRYMRSRAATHGLRSNQPSGDVDGER